MGASSGAIGGWATDPHYCGSPAGGGYRAEYLAIGLLRLLPESLCKAILVAGLGKLADPLGALGHAAGLSDPDAYHAILERALD